MGKKAALHSWASLQELADDYSEETHAILADEKHAVILGRATTSRNGETATMDTITVFHMSGGKATEGWMSFVDQYAADEFWA